MSALVFVGAIPVAHATVVTWELDNVRFDDLGTASGFFTLDDHMPGLLKDFDITTTAGSSNPHFHYTPATTAGAVNKALANGILLGLGRNNQLQLSATSPLRLSGGGLVTNGTLPLDTDASREFLFPDDIFRHVVTGGSLTAISLTAVPEPSEIGYFVGGLFALAGIDIVKRLHTERRGGIRKSACNRSGSACERAPT